MKCFAFLILIVITAKSHAANEMHCGNIKTMRIWAGGSDTYGVWIEYDNNPTSCPGGFYVKHSADNKELVYSLALASKMAGQKVCIQTNIGVDIGNRCQLNYIMQKNN